MPNISKFCSCFCYDLCCKPHFWLSPAAIKLNISLLLKSLKSKLLFCMLDMFRRAMCRKKVLRIYYITRLIQVSGGVFPFMFFKLAENRISPLPRTPPLYFTFEVILCMRDPWKSGVKNYNKRCCSDCWKTIPSSNFFLFLSYERVCKISRLAAFKKN